MEAKWIWYQDNFLDDDYAEFVLDFNANSLKHFIKISADSNYAIYLNNKYVNASQYACFPTNPVYDVVKLNTKIGINQLKIIVYYVGVSTFSTYFVDKPGLYFEIKDENDNVVAISNTNIKSAQNKTFISQNKKIITPQLGYKFFYDANNENIKLDYKNSVIVNKSYNLTKRENKPLSLFPKIVGKDTNINTNKRHILVDLLKENTGFIYLDFESALKSNILVCFGEHILDNKVRQIIGNRDFSFNYISKPGRNKFFSPLRRFGCRYIELFSDKDIKINEVSLIPTIYPFRLKNYKIDNDLRQKIYDTCVYTLICCYHEHYEDCPWREQSFYSLDSRNQILAGYFAFYNKEQVRSAIKLMLQDNRKDNLLSICYPSSLDLTIPSFSLHFFTTMYEYYKYTKDKELLNQSYDRLYRLINAFIDNIHDGLLYNFEGSSYWNFYEWRDGLDYHNAKCDLILNCLFIIALNNFIKI